MIPGSAPAEPDWNAIAAKGLRRFALYGMRMESVWNPYGR